MQRQPRRGWLTEFERVVTGADFAEGLARYLYSATDAFEAAMREINAYIASKN